MITTALADGCGGSEMALHLLLEEVLEDATAVGARGVPQRHSLSFEWGVEHICGNKNSGACWGVEEGGEMALLRKLPLAMEETMHTWPRKQYPRVEFRAKSQTWQSERF